jgi:hypothetical protein
MAQRRTWARYLIWGSIAVCAVLAAAFTIAVVVGAHRGIQIAGLPKRLTAAPPPIERPQAKAPVPAVTGHDLARVNDALRDLAAERDRLVIRLEQIERSVGDITASIRDRVEPELAASRQAMPAPKSLAAISPAESEPVANALKPSEGMPAVTVAPPPSAAATRAAIPVASTGPSPGEPIDIFRPYSAAQPLIGMPAPAQAPMQIHALPRTTELAAPRDLPQTRDAGTTRTEFAIDLGTDTSMDGLRSLWANLRGNHGTALEGLRPLVSVRDGAKPGSVEMRLIAGPLANAGAAARTCAALQTKGVACQTTIFDGQRLALR